MRVIQFQLSSLIAAKKFFMQKRNSIFLTKFETGNLVTLYCFCTLVMLFFCQVLAGQVPSPLPQNKYQNLYLQTDRESYLSGDTIWVKGYFRSEYLPSNNNTSLTIYLVDINNSTIISPLNFRVVNNSAFGMVPLVDDLASGIYTLVAYSPLMLNGPNQVFKKRIRVYNKYGEGGIGFEYEKQFSFYPEGGTLVIGDSNRVAFKYADDSGEPFNVSGEVYSKSGKMITTFNTMHGGMGYFKIKPGEEGNYAIIDGDEKNIKYALPGAVHTGIVLNLSNKTDTIEYTINHVRMDTIYKPAFIIAQNQDVEVFSESFTQNMQTVSGTFPVKNMRSGILRIAVFNKDTLLLAERLCFVNSKEYVLPATFNSSIQNINSKSENLYALTLNEAINGSFAISVTDANYEGRLPRAQNIYSSFLLTNCLKEYVHYPAYYFKNDNASIRNSLDLVMMTNKWGGTKWEDWQKTSPVSSGIVNSRVGELSGTVFYENTKRRYSNKSILMIALAEDSTSQTTIFTTDSAGRFSTASLKLIGRNKLLLSPAYENKKDFIDVKLDRIELPVASQLLKHKKSKPNIKKVPSNKVVINPAYDSLANNKEILERITINAKGKSDLEILNERYANGWYKSNMGEIYDFTKMNTGSIDILGYLMPGYRDIRVEFDNFGRYVVKARNIVGEVVSCKIYLNEVPVESDQLYGIQSKDVAMIKMLEKFELIDEKLSPAIAIYTRKGPDYTASDANYDIEYYNGFNTVKQFGSKRNDHQPLSAENNRITLFWNPKAATSKRVSIIPIHFYNTHEAKSFKVVVEGMSEDGRLLMFETVIEQSAF